MIKIKRATEIDPPADIGGIRTIGLSLDIDGYEWYVGGLDASLYPPTAEGKVALMAFLQSQEADWLRQAKGRGVDTSSPTTRTDLIDSQYQPRDIETEIDDLKTRMEKLERR